MRVLVVVAAKEDELQRARKQFGYDKLHLLVPTGTKDTWTKRVEGLPAQVEELPEHDLLPCLERLEALLRSLRKEEVRVAVDGGTSAMSQAAFLACLSEGVEAWWLLHKAVRLPVLRARPIAARFQEDELAVLRVLDARLRPAEVAQRARLEEERAKAALLTLRKQGVVDSNASGAAPTELGRYVQRGLEAA